MPIISGSANTLIDEKCSSFAKIFTRSIVSPYSNATSKRALKITIMIKTKKICLVHTCTDERKSGETSDDICFNNL